jgi:signal transduction histidine kinase
MWIYHVTLVAVIVIGVSASIYMATTEHRSGRAEMINRVRTIATALTSDDIKSLYGSEADLTNSEYARLKQLFMDIRSANDDIRFVYINGMKDDGIFFYLDSEDPTSEDYSPPGQVYEEASELMYEIFETGEAGFEIERDRWGFWMSALAPVMNEDDTEVAALVGIDVPADKYIFNIVSYGAVPLLLTVIVALIIIFTERARRREIRMAEQKAEFFSIATHEIRTPLTGMRWAVESVLGSKELSMSAEVSTIFTRLHDNTVNLIDRLNNLLDLSALEGGKDGKTESVVVLPILERIKETYLLTALSRGITIAVDPQIKKDLSVTYDTEGYWRVMVNLVANAVKYTRDNTTITLAYNQTADEHLFSVKDQGEGISESDIPHIFEGYVRTDAARQSDQTGTGIGLALSQKIAHVNGGKISVASKKGEGSTFTLHIKK